MIFNLLSVWSTIGSVLLAILILLVMITIHEFGHYLAGKIFHFTINEFSIGFGPALFKHRNKKTGELFAVRLIPLGGYCAFEGEDGLDEEEAEKKPKEQSVSPFRDFKEAEKELSEKEAAEAPEKPLEETNAEKKEKDPGAFTNRPCYQRIIVLIAGALMNYLLALFLILVCFFSYGQTMTAVYKSDGMTDASGYGLQDYDILLSVEGKNIYLMTDIAKAVNGKKQGDLVEFRVSRAVNFRWETDENGNERARYDGREEQTVKVMMRCDVNVKNSAELDVVYQAIGIGYEKTENGEGYLLASSLYKFGFGETVGRSFIYSFKIAGSIFRVLGELLTGKLGLSAFGGPITTVTMTSQIVSRGFRYFLEIASYIGVNLAVFNLLPIPALDGSKVVFTAIEWVRGKPISRKIEAIIHAVGFVLLLGFAILVDILQFI